MSAQVSVLVIEDDPWLRELYARTLETAGFAVRAVANGHSAIDQIDTRPPKVIVLDMLLTGGTGVTLLHELQSYIDTAQIPVIICSSIGDSLALADMAAYGVRRILDKTTMHPDDIVTAVRSVVV